MSTRCPIDGCEFVKGPIHIMCARHWRIVPARVRDQVWKAWKNRQAHPNESGAIARHRAAMAAAIRAAAGPEPPPPRFAPAS